MSECIFFKRANCYAVSSSNAVRIPWIHVHVLCIHVWNKKRCVFKSTFPYLEHFRKETRSNLFTDKIIQSCQSGHRMAQRLTRRFWRCIFIFSRLLCLVLGNVFCDRWTDGVHIASNRSASSKRSSWRSSGSSSFLHFSGHFPTSRVFISSHKIQRNQRKTKHPILCESHIINAERWGAQCLVIKSGMRGCVLARRLPPSLFSWSSEETPRDLQTAQPTYQSATKLISSQTFPCTFHWNPYRNLQTTRNLSTQLFNLPARGAHSRNTRSKQTQTNRTSRKIKLHTEDECFR